MAQNGTSLTECPRPLSSTMRINFTPFREVDVGKMNCLVGWNSLLCKKFLNPPKQGIRRTLQEKIEIQLRSN